MDKIKIIDKIQKCLRLAQSGNAHEAASALRQAQGMMRKYGIAEAEVRVEQVTEACASSAGYFNPPYWAVALSELVASAFDCRAYLGSKQGGPEFRFIGVGASSEVSAYTFTVLFRQLRQARRHYMNQLEVSERQERTRRGHVFAQAWLFHIAKTVADFANDRSAQAAIDAYVKEHYGETDQWQRPAARLDNQDYDVIVLGLKAAQQVQLVRPVENAADCGSLDEQVQWA
ncbi:MAG: DUF2786 domain-containing protein [Gammaproteobacteria bacterium]|nr:DUF2786 domain-containing protein [Gammaproteobacteria bacterium]